MGLIYRIIYHGLD